MMKSEADPITEDEWLLRRVRYERFCTDDVPVISPNAFEPRVNGCEPDIDGISFYRSECLADPTDVLKTVKPERRHEYAIVRVPVSLLKAKGFSVQPKPDGIIPGHVVIPATQRGRIQKEQSSIHAHQIASRHRGKQGRQHLETSRTGR